MRVVHVMMALLVVLAGVVIWKQARPPVGEEALSPVLTPETPTVSKSAGPVPPTLPTPQDALAPIAAELHLSRNRDDARTTPAYRALAEAASAATANASQSSIVQMANALPLGRPAVVDREGYPEAEDNPVRRPAEDPVSTFSIDVDTASYANVRRQLNQGRLPRHESVRAEEIVNYFDYAYPMPEADEPFAVYTEIGPSPWHAQRRLLHIGIQGAVRSAAELPPANLVFLVDVSGSMQSPDKLDLLKASLRLLVGQLRPQDTVSMVVYAGAAGVVLEPTAGDQRATILGALNQLQAGGSTNGGEGIELAYALAEQHLVEDGVNRVILATDGDFNVGTVDHDALEELIERKREAGVALTVLGFGRGNYQDGLMQRLAQKGNGNAAYVDTLNEARKVLVDELAATLEIIAQDVKIQVEFNPAVVAEYRLIGYENRQLAREDFNNDRVDAGDIGAGHTVTALYELALVGEGGAQVDPLRYAARNERGRFLGRPVTDEIAHLRLRYKRPGEASSELIERPLLHSALRDRLADTSEDFRFSAATAAYAQLLSGARYTGEMKLVDVLTLAREARGADPFGYRGEFLTLVASADALSSVQQTTGR